MATRRPLVRLEGKSAAMPAGDRLPADCLPVAAMYDAGNSGAAITIDGLNGANQTVLLTAATVIITIVNLAQVGRLRLVRRQDSTGGRAASYVISGRTLLYQGGTAPLSSTAPNARDVHVLTDDAVSGVVDVDAGVGYAAP